MIRSFPSNVRYGAEQEAVNSPTGRSAARACLVVLLSEGPLTLEKSQNGLKQRGAATATHDTVRSLGGGGHREGVLQ